MEISEAYRFCPLCGCKRAGFTPARPFRCESCGHTSFFGPVTAVGGVVTNSDGQVLLIERAREPGLGKLGMPGGFVDPQESAEAAVRREIQEEVGVAVGDLTFLMTAPNTYRYQGVILPVLDIFYSAKIQEGQVIAQDASEVSSWMWTDISTEILDRMAFHSNRLAMEFYFQSLGR